MMLSNKNYLDQYKYWLNLIFSINSTEENYNAVAELLFSTYANNPVELLGFFRRIYYIMGSSRYSEKQLRHLANIYSQSLSYICERFGFFEEKEKLDTRSFLILDKDEYERIGSLLSEYKKKAGHLVRKAVYELSRVISHDRFSYTIDGRYKTLPSIYKKCKKKKLNDVNRLGDLFAFRIIIEQGSVEDCFEILTILHDTFDPIVERYNDYISVPKINGYQSLHTDINVSKYIPDIKIPIEVQIRTRIMHELSEKGAAAHFLYARNKESFILSEKEKKIYINRYQENSKIYCLTRDNNIIFIDLGSTVADFAYKIHSHLGDCMTGAIVNDVYVPKTHLISQGDRIEILTK